MIATTAASSKPALSAEQAYQQALQVTLQLAVRHHQDDQLQEAGQLYRSILQGEPDHPEANHNLGILMLEMAQPAEGLAHLEAALAARPESQRYWLSYLYALVHSGQTELARERLAFAREHGLEGAAAQALAVTLEADGRAPSHCGVDEVSSA